MTEECGKEENVKYICLAFEVHQPFRLRNDFFWSKRMFSGDSDIFEKYFFSEKDKEIFEKVARKCYYPTNNIILELLDDFDLRVAYSISGIFVEQCLRFDEGVLDSFKELARRDDVEILGQTYFHSLVSLYEDYAEFREQVRMHNELMHEVFGREPKFFENTELLYNNRIARFIETMGYDGIFAEGVPRILQGRSPNYVYKPVNCKRLKVLLRNYQLTDDVGFRFSSKSWNEYPLTAEKYATWLDATPGQCVNVFMDYETFGEHHWEDTGIFEFLRAGGGFKAWEHGVRDALRGDKGVRGDRLRGRAGHGNDLVGGRGEGYELFHREHDAVGVLRVCEVARAAREGG